jgi:hypothetical protein
MPFILFFITLFGSTILTAHPGQAAGSAATQIADHACTTPATRTPSKRLSRKVGTFSAIQN